MPLPTLLSDVITPAWDALTADQRTCWHFWALKHPQLDAAGELRTMYGKQAHYSRNAQIAVIDDPPLLTTPPPDAAPPVAPTVYSQAWPLQSKTISGETARRGVCYAILDGDLPDDTAIILRQGYTYRKSGKGPRPRIRHCTVRSTLTTDAINLDDPSGYFASTDGDTKYAHIKGVNAQRRPDLPLGSIKVVDLNTGLYTEAAIPNPFGGTRTKANRARATSVNPGPDDHFP